MIGLLVMVIVLVVILVIWFHLFLQSQEPSANARFYNNAQYEFSWLFHSDLANMYHLLDNTCSNSFFNSNKENFKKTSCRPLILWKLLLRGINFGRFWNCLPMALRKYMEGKLMKTHTVQWLEKFSIYGARRRNNKGPNYGRSWQVKQ